MEGKRYGGLFSMLSALILAAGLMAGSGTTPAQAAGPGPETCKNCHVSQVESYAASKHGTKGDPRSPANAGACSTCHGDGSAHVKAGGGKGVGGIINPASKSLPSVAKNSACLTCHQGGKRIHWAGSMHAASDVSCASCHSMHKGKDKVLAKATQAEVCYTCHKEQRTQFNKPSHHPVPEGKMTCSSCHNVHGDNPKKLVKSSTNDTCYTCHMEKRGPFVHNHQPVAEDCGICHNPHGTTVPNLLKSRAPFLCQECHSTVTHSSESAGLPAVGTTSRAQLGTVGRGCLNCHTNIHGGNSTVNSATSGRFRR